METTAPLDPSIADKLLDLLGSDDAFRDLFQKDPLAALEQLGYRPPVEGVPPPFHACCHVQQLASKEAIVEARTELQGLLTRGLAYTTPNLDALNTAK